MKLSTLSHFGWRFLFLDLSTRIHNGASSFFAKSSALMKWGWNFLAGCWGWYLDAATSSRLDERQPHRNGRRSTPQQCLAGEGLHQVVQLGTGRPRGGAAESRHEFLACPRPVEQREQLSTEGILIPECLVIETWNDLVLAIEPTRCGESLGTFAIFLFASG